MKVVKTIILFLLVLGAFANAGMVLAMSKELSEENMVIADDVYAAIERNNLTEAERLLKIAFKNQPDNYDLHMIMADVMEKRQNWSGVVKYLTAVIKAYPNDAYAYAMRGFALLNQDKPDLALKDFENSQRRGKLAPEVAKYVVAAIADIKAIDTVDSIDVSTPEGYVPQPDSFSKSEDLWKKAEYYQEQDNPGLALKYARESVRLIPDNRDRNLQIAYLALQYEQDKEAVLYFEKALSLKGPSSEDASIHADVFYAYKRLGDTEKALYYLEKVIADTNERIEKAGGRATDEDISNNYYLRREHADLVRQFGADTGVYYNRIKDGGYALQGIQEIYWQPYYKNGKYLRIFATGIETLKSNMYKDGTDSLHAIVGFVLDPLTDYNLSLGADHVFKIGDATESETRLRVAHSWDIGSELNPVASDWNYLTLFQEYLYAMKNSYSVYSGEARGGKSFKISALSNRFVVSPHVFVSGNYNSLNSKIIIGGRDWDVYAGPGVHFRKWYREDALNAPRSYLDFIVQYRAAVTSKSDSMLYIILSNNF